jgi:hypothetical protein
MLKDVFDDIQSTHIFVVSGCGYIVLIRTTLNHIPKPISKGNVSFWILHAPMLSCKVSIYYIVESNDISVKEYNQWPKSSPQTKKKFKPRIDIPPVVRQVYSWLGTCRTKDSQFSESRKPLSIMSKSSPFSVSKIPPHP